MATATPARPELPGKDWAVPNLQRGLAILEYLAAGLRRAQSSRGMTLRSPNSAGN